MKGFRLIGAGLAAVLLLGSLPACQTKQLKEKVASLEQANQTMTQEKTDLSNRVNELTNQVNALQGQVGSLTQERDNLKQQVATMEAEKGRGKKRR